jgi:Ser/Thr protein kinase RdoA (MazF antagonist)
VGLTVTTRIEDIAAGFAVPCSFAAARPYGQGLIHESFLLDFARGQEVVRCMLQRINTDVFSDPVSMIENIRRVTQHVASGLRATGVPDADRRTLDIIPTRDNDLLLTDHEGSRWRMYRFIEGAKTYSLATTAWQAEQAGLIFGAFQRALVDLPPPRLHETIPGFHDTPTRFAALERAVQADDHSRVAIAKREIDSAFSQRASADMLLRPYLAGEVPERVVHNDAKITNVLFDKANDKALSVVDLDTVMPGIAAFDFGDMVRTMATTASEDETDLEGIEVDLTLFEALARGYLTAAGSFLTSAERAQLVSAGRIIALEQAVRFLTDYLNGDVYYRTSRPGHNLDRCRAQFKVVESLMLHEEQMRRILKRL